MVRLTSKGRCFFLLTCARSGSTSLAKILNEAENGICVVEPSPNLNRETRLAMDGRLKESQSLIERVVLPRIQEGLTVYEIYGEKNLTYGPFILHLYELLHCNFVFIKRDGRDVVRSMMDWHNRMFGSIYRECQDPGNLASRAISAAANLPVHLDTSDFSRPRPRSDSLYFDEWESFSREEMCAYYWATINELYLDQLANIPEDSWIEIDYTDPVAEDILKVAEFCGLSGLNEGKVADMLESKINSLKERCTEERMYPDWQNWSREKREQFDRIAAPAMRRMNYYSEKQ